MKDHADKLLRDLVLDFSLETMSLFTANNLTYVSDLYKLSDSDVEGLKGGQPFSIQEIQHFCFAARTPTEIEDFKNNYRKALGSSTEITTSAGEKVRDVMNEIPSSHIPAKDNESIPVSSELNKVLLKEFDFSLRAQNVFRQNNIMSISDLFDLSSSQLMRLENFGQTTLAEIEDFKQGFTNGTLLRSGRTNTTERLLNVLSQEVMGLSIDLLHIGMKIEHFKKHGLNKIRDLYPLTNLRLVPRIGPGTVKLIHQRLDYISDEIDDQGEFHLESYLSKIGVIMIPSSSIPDTGTNFLEALPEVINEIVANLDDEDYQNILRLRISKHPDQQHTLDQIAGLRSKKVTRERIRQKEEKLLRELADGMVRQKFGKLNLHFHRDFTRWWELAARGLMDSGELDLFELLDKLSDIWNVDPVNLNKHLPFILSIISGEPQSVVTCREASHYIKQNAYPQSLREMQLKKLRIGKSYEVLMNGDMRTVNDVLSRQTDVKADHFSRNSQTPKYISSGLIRAVNTVTEHLNIFDNYRQNNGDTLAHYYRQSLGLRVFPERFDSDPKNFIDNVRSNVALLLEGYTTFPLASEVFKLRTSRAKDTRLTLESVGNQLGKHGPVIKRGETLFLGFLHNLLVVRDFSRSSVWFESSWLEFWKQLHEVFENTNSNYTRFGLNLSEFWNVPSEKLNKALPTLWAILKGYPHGRRVGYRHEPITEKTIDEMVPIKIKLSGFRRNY